VILLFCHAAICAYVIPAPKCLDINLTSVRFVVPVSLQKLSFFFYFLNEKKAVKSMIEIKINKQADEAAENSEDEEPVLVKKSKQHRIQEEDDVVSTTKTESSQDEM
jgi:hypothetical protein